MTIEVVDRAISLLQEARGMLADELAAGASA